MKTERISAKINSKNFIAPAIVLAVVLAIAVSYWIYKPKRLNRSTAKASGIL